MNSTIKLFVTGGTFDKEYNELTGEMYFKETHIFEMLNLGRCRIPTSVETLMMTDSLHMKESQIKYIVQRCAEDHNVRIVITHGTDRMTDTARRLAKTVRDKTVVLTGAMVPYRFGSSDGLFNLGSALSFVQILPPGVYIAMNGHIFDWDNVRKNRELGIFEPLRSRKSNTPRRKSGKSVPAGTDASTV